MSDVAQLLLVPSIWNAKAVHLSRLPDSFLQIKLLTEQGYAPAEAGAQRSYTLG